MNKRSLILIAMSAVPLWLTSSLALAQQMSPEQKALYDQMIRSTGMDPKQIEAAQRQADVATQFGDVIRYSVLGVYQGQTNVSADQNWIAYADVGDRVQMQFEWKVSEAKLMGTPAIQNHKATLANPRNWEKKCSPPKVNGAFEYDLKSVAQGIGANVRLQMQTSFPPVQVHQMCTGALKSIAPKQVANPIEFMVPPPTMLAMALPPNGDVTHSADGKSLIYKKDGWTWTFTPRGKQ